MPPPVVQTLSNLKSLHLFRGLLRAASYLPDATARSYLHQHIVARFKAYQPRNTTPSAVDNLTRHRALIIKRTPALQKRARKGLDYLRRANLGDSSCLEKVLLYTYGRVGPRRYELLEQLMQPDSIQISEEVGGTATSSPLQQQYYSDKRFLSFFDAPRNISPTHCVVEISDRYAPLKEVLKSQCQQHVSMGRELKQPKFKMDIYNAWNRPMPIKRARNHVKKWYAVTMARLLPPLPGDEWDRLKALATGALKWREGVLRRKPAMILTAQPDDADARLGHLFERGIALDKPTLADKLSAKRPSSTITSRMMKRIYQKVLGLSCKLEWDESRNRWSAQWGSQVHITPAAHAAPIDDILFAGVEKNGRSIQVKAPSQSQDPFEKLAPPSLTEERHHSTVSATVA
jgi:hypothetical protein